MGGTHLDDDDVSPGNLSGKAKSPSNVSEYKPIHPEDMAGIRSQDKEPFGEGQSEDVSGVSS